MPVGIEKVGIVSRSGQTTSPKSFVMQADEIVEIKAEYYPDTPEALKGHAKWIVKPKDGAPYSKNDQTGKIGDSRGLSVEPKYCGPKKHVVEAFIDDPSNVYPQQLTFQAQAPQKIISTKWSKAKGGANVGQSPIKYGDDIWLYVETEGLNGAMLDIDVYLIASMGSDDKIATLGAVPCIAGEVNVHVKNTYAWRAGTGIWTNSTEKFYIKIRVSGSSKTILDKKKDDEHARFLRIKNEISTRQVESHQTARPATVGQTEVNIERYELCRFKKIAVTDDKKNIVVFDEGKLKIDTQRKAEFQVSETIHFDLDKHNIRNDAKPVLDGIANLLLDNPYVSTTLGAHCDIRADHEYNDKLSQRRAAAAKKYLVGKGVSQKLIFAKGYGKRKLLIEGENISEEEHQLNRRVTIEFMIFGADAESIVFDTIAPDDSKKKKVAFTIDLFETDKCLNRGTNLQHHSKVKVIELTSQGKKGPYEYDGTSTVEHEVYSNLSRLKVVPLQYIWPHKNTTNNFEFFINSCRYYSDKEKATVIVKAYPDIKWDFHFFLNLSNSPSVTWQKLPASKAGEMRGKAGKIGAENRHKQTEIDFGVILEANWNKSGKAYDSKFDVTFKYESKIKKFYDLFSSLKKISKGITSQTKGKVAKSRLGKTLPFSVEVVPPNFCLGAEWQLTRAQKNNVPIKEIGTEVKFYLKSKPIIGLKMIVDLLDLLVQGAVAAASGGTANVAAKKIFDEVRAWLADDDHAINIKMYIDLEFFGTIQGGAEFKYHTISDKNEGQLNLDATIGIELKAGIEVKAGVVVVGVEFYANGQLKASGKGSITFGHKLVYNSNGGKRSLNYRPELKFDGIEVQFVIKASVGMAIRKGWFSGASANRELANYNYKDKVVNEFDIIKQLEKFSGISPEIPLIKSDS